MFQAAVKEAQQAVNDQKALLKSCNKDINEKVSQQHSLHKESSNIDLKLKELDHKVSKCNKDAKEAARQVND